MNDITDDPEASAHQRVEALSHTIRNGLKPDLEESAQIQLSELINLLPDIAAMGDRQLITNAEVAATALLLEQPDILLGKNIIEVLQQRIRLRKNILVRMQHALNPRILRPFSSRFSPAILIVLGLGALLYFAIPISILVSDAFIMEGEKILDIPVSLLAMIAVAGGIGSIVSIMVRIQDFARVANVDPAVLFLTGFFKPIIGMAFALFLFAAIEAKILPISIDEEKKTYFFIALSFVAGFSERFARDIATKIEDTVGGSQ